MIFGFGIKKRTPRKTASNDKREALVALAREQFKKLVDKGINIPVALL